MKKLILAFCLLFAVKAFSAEEANLNGVISGKVIDKETRQPIAGAVVKIYNTKLGKYADKNGEFTIANIPIGRYSLGASIIGYEAQMINDVAVVTKRTTYLEFELNLKSVKKNEITVKAETSQTAKEEATISQTTVSQDELRFTPGTPDLFRRTSI